MVKTTITYQGGLRTAAQHGPSGAAFQTDAPVDNNGKGESFSPTDLVGAALGSCILTIMGIVAERMGVDLTGATASVEKSMVAEPKRRIGALKAHIIVPAKVSESDQRKLERAALTCPVHQSLHPDIHAPITFEWGG
jgi:putative redox protein